MNDKSLGHLFMAEVTSGCVLIRDVIAWLRQLSPLWPLGSGVLHG